MTTYSDKQGETPHVPYYGEDAIRRAHKRALRWGAGLALVSILGAGAGLYLKSQEGPSRDVQIAQLEDKVNSEPDKFGIFFPDSGEGQSAFVDDLSKGKGADESTIAKEVALEGTADGGMQAGGYAIEMDALSPQMQKQAAPVEGRYTVPGER